MSEGCHISLLPGLCRVNTTRRVACSNATTKTMKNKETVFFLLILLLVFSSFSACRKEVADTRASLVITVSAEQGGETKTINPDTSMLKITSYELSGYGPNGALLEKLESVTGRFQVENIRCGLWNLEATALNADGIQIARGTKSLEVRKSTGTTNMILSELPGTGRLELTFQVDGDLAVTATSSLMLIIEVYDQTNQNRTTYSRSVDRNKLSASFSQESIHAGSYEVSAVLYKDNTMVTSAIEAVRVVGSTTTSGTISLVVDNTSDLSDVTITNDVSAPILGTIKVQKKGSGNDFKSYLMVYKTLSMPAGLSENDLSFRWYCGGIPISNGNTSTCEVSPAKDSKYTIMVTSSKLGSTGSCSVVLKALNNTDNPTGGPTIEPV